MLGQPSLVALAVGFSFSDNPYATRGVAQLARQVRLTQKGLEHIVARHWPTGQPVVHRRRESFWKAPVRANFGQ